MNVLFLAEELRVGGAETYFYSLENNINRNDFNFYCMAVDGEQKSDVYKRQLLKILREYVKERHICSGSIFITSKGNPVNRSNVWRMMKNLCRVAGVSEEKVYPHSMRHLFARSFYKIKKDIRCV